jgi:hypothetical protein
MDIGPAEWRYQRSAHRASPATKGSSRPLPPDSATTRIAPRAVQHANQPPSPPLCSPAPFPSIGRVSGKAPRPQHAHNRLISSALPSSCSCPPHVTPQNSEFWNVTKIHYILKLFLGRLKIVFRLQMRNQFN